MRRMSVVFLACCMAAACGGGGSPTAVTEEPSPLAFGGELQQVLVDGLKASNGVGVSAAVIVAGYDPWVGVAGYSSGLEAMRPDMLFRTGSSRRTSPLP